MSTGNNSHTAAGSDLATASRPNKGLHITLWVIQVLLAALFVSTGRMKLVMPPAAIAQLIHLPVPFVRFLGVAELLGAAGLVLPGLLRLYTGLTPLAAACLTVIMAGAVVVTAQMGMVLLAAYPLIVGILTAFIAWARWRKAPLRSR